MGSKDLHSPPQLSIKAPLLSPNPIAKGLPLNKTVIMDLLLASLALTTPSLSAYEADQQHPISAPQPLGPQLSIPLLGFGTWNLDRANASDAVAVALQTGYRHVDCAAAYGNEKEVGRGIEEGMKLAGVGRGEVWVTSKLWNDR